MEDAAPLMYGLESPARAVACQIAETDVVRFFVAPQNPTCKGPGHLNKNHVHLVEVDDEFSQLEKRVFFHPAGEVWDIIASPTDPQLLMTIHSIVSDDLSECKEGITIWKLPDDGLLSASSREDLKDQPVTVLEERCSLPVEEEGEHFCAWDPANGDRVLTLSEKRLHVWNVDDGSPKEQVSLDIRTSKDRSSWSDLLACCKWGPHQNCSMVAVGFDTCLCVYDLRSGKVGYSIEKPHDMNLRNVDFNPNKPYFLATCGDDGKVCFWDMRAAQKPLFVMGEHTHWVWSVKFNPFHDQLVLSGSSDGRVILTSAASISSEPLNQMGSESVDSNSQTASDVTTHERTEDGVVMKYEDHEDSVYAVEWSVADPWTFASVSYDGRLVLNKVPRSEKYKILL